MDKKEEKSPLTIVKDEEQLPITKNKEEKKKPTQEEIDQYQKDFSDSVKNFENFKWQISEPGQFGINDVGIYLLDFMNKYAFWSKTEWMGLIKMEDEVKKAMSMSDPSIGIALSYQALEFCAYMLSNPGGTGLKLAKEFETQADKYSKIGMVVGSQIEDARKQLKEIQYKQNRWACAEQGGYIEDYLKEQEELNKKGKENVAEQLNDHLSNLNSQLTNKPVELKVDNKEE